MSNNPLQSDPDALHQSAIDVITHVSNVMSEGCGILREHDRLLAENQGEHRLGAEIKDIEKGIGCVNEKLERVKRKELTMTIVAPTSAGKSTIINAIAGQDLLPSRNDAMTVLPTEIVFSRQVTHPKLLLDKALMTLLREVWGELHQKLQPIGIKEAVEQATKNDFPRENVIKEILNSSSVSFQSEVEESNTIQAELIRINDLLRLCGIFGIATDFLSSLSEIPRIEVPFPQQLSSLKDSDLGTLALVDTPGPSEDKSLNLVNVVKERLKVSSLVLVVVDYTKIGQTDPVKVKKLVDEIAEVKGRDRIYIIVNKIDARDPNNLEDLTTQQIFDLVKTKYEIDDPENRVFEMSAVEAFLATNFQREREIYTLIELRERTSFEALGQKYYAKSWKTKKTTVELEEMQKAADEFLQDSGFVGFIDKAIALLVLSIKNELKDVSQRLTSFLSCLSKQKGILERYIQQLEIEINQLEIDLNEAIKMLKNHEWKLKINDIKIASHNIIREEKISSVLYWNRNKNRPINVLWNELDSKLDSLDGRVFAKINKKTFFWEKDVYEIDMNVMRDTWRLIAEVSIDLLIKSKLLAISYLFGDNFRIIVNELILSWNLASISYHENILMKAEKKMSKNFQFHFIPDWTQSLFHFYSQKLVLTVDTDESFGSCVGARYESYHRMVPKIYPEIDSVSHWLSSELMLKIDGKRLDSTEIYHNFLAISEQLRLKLKQPINDSIETLITECLAVKEFPMDTFGYAVRSMEYRIDKFIHRHTEVDEVSGEAKISLRIPGNIYPFSCFDNYILFFEIDGFPSIDSLLIGQVDKIMEDYFKSFNEEINRFLTEYRESIIYSISELKETVNKYSSIKNECIRLSEIGTDLQLSIKHQ